MRRSRTPPLHLGALLAATAIAPPVAVIMSALFGAITGLSGEGDFYLGLVGSLGGVVVVAMIAMVLGAPAAFAYGLVGALLAERWLRSKPVWPWALAGGLTAVVHIGAALAFATAPSNPGVWMAPWAETPTPDNRASLIVRALAIVMAGALAGLLYREIARFIPGAGPTYDPLGADKGG